MQIDRHTLSISGLSCASCVGRVERALNATSGVTGVNVSLPRETASLQVNAPNVLLDVVKNLQIAGYPAREDQRSFLVEGLNCASCVGRLQSALQSLAGVIDVQVNLAAQSVTIRFLEGIVTERDCHDAAEKAGYPLKERGDLSGVDASQASEIDVILRNMLVAAVLTLPVFITEMGGHLFPALHHWLHRTVGLQNLWAIQALLISLVLIWPGRLFFSRGIPALIRGAADMNSLVALGAGAAWFYSMCVTFFPTWLPSGLRAVYFEAAGVIVTLVLLGRWLEARAKGKAGAAINALLSLQTPTARLLKDGYEIEVAIETLVAGDLITVKPGEQIALDGEVVEGRSQVDEAMLTGEAGPVLKEIGHMVTGGTLNGTGALTVRLTRVGKDTTLSRIIEMVEHAQATRMPMQRLIDQVTMWFVPVVMALAGVTFAFWFVFGPAPTLAHALVVGVSVLIIACPCAMGLATPMSIMVGSGRAAELGVFFRRGEALQHLMRCDLVAFDKTGTLTEGKPRVTQVEFANLWDSEKLLPLVASAERPSEHPMSFAITQFAKNKDIEAEAPTDFEAIPGQGILATVEGRSVYIGSGHFMDRHNINIEALQSVAEKFAKQGQTVVFVAVDNELAALFAVADPIKESAKDTIDALRASGTAVAMITGDRKETADAVAQQLGIENVIAEVLPDGKVAALAQLQTKFGRLAFVGDGINDAPALAHADVGIAMGSGTDVAIESADVVLMSGDPQGVLNAYRLSNATMRNIKQNLGWAFGYNIVLIPVAAGVLYPIFGILMQPGFAALAMAFSSVSVVANALRLRRVATRPGQSQR